jgi:hypothetical protein
LDCLRPRTGAEGRINHIKRSYGWNRTELTGINGVRTWCGHGVFAHNLVKVKRPPHPADRARYPTSGYKRHPDQGFFRSK